MALLARLLRRLVSAMADSETGSAVLSDLDEEFASRRDVDGLRSARRWYVSQAVRSVLPLARRRYRRRTSQTPARRMWTIRPHLVQAARALRRAPAFTTMTVVTLALGIGVSTAAFTAVSAALLSPLPYPTQARLAVLSETHGSSEISVSYPDFIDWQTRAVSFEALAAFRGYTGTLTGDGIAERIRGQIVTSDLFKVLGVEPAIGHAFDPDADRAGAPATVLLGEGLWRRRLGADPGVVGTWIHLDGTAFQVVGVMPRGFRFPDGIVYGAPDVYLPLGPFFDADLANRDSHPGLACIGLLRPGITIDRARDEMNRIQARIGEEHADTNREVGLRLQDAVTVIVGDLRAQLTIVWGASLVLLLIACANVAGLTLTRAVSKRRELALRTALGGSRASIAATLVAEQVTVAMLGTAAGVVLAFGLTAAARRYVTDLPRLTGLQPDLRALAFAVVLMGITTLASSVAPLAWLSRASLDPWLRERAQSHRGWRLRRTLVGAQVALALTLVASAGLLSASLGELQRRTGGIVSTGVLTFDLRLPDRNYARDALTTFYRDLYTRLAAGPRVSAVGGISTLPFSGNGAQSGIMPSTGSVHDAVRTDVAVVTTDYFRAMGVQLLRGRAFDDRDGPTTPAVTVVDERFAERLWPGRNPLGQHVAGWGFHDLEVVGVVGHVDNYGVGEESREELYVSFAQRPTPRLFTVVRSGGDPSALATFVRETVSDIDSSLAVADVQLMDVVVGRTIAGQRLAAVLSGGFGTLAILLASVGIYGLVAYAVELRRREAGIRLALGAAPGAVVRLMALGVAAALAAGTLIGLGGALAAGTLLHSQLFAVRPYDPEILLASTIALVATATVATWLPARRIARVSPAITLQVE
jgi:putative ABC transport system permease protein